MAVLDETRAIIEEGETYEGTVMPTVRAELSRPVTIHPDATVTEGVYGETIAVENGAVVEGPMLAKEAVALDGGEVSADVGTPGKVTGEDARVRGTVTANRVRLTDCLVHGNVVGDHVILEDCLVLGVVTGQQHLTLDATTCYTFKSYIEGAFTNAKLLFGQAIADGEVTIDTPIPVVSLKHQLVEDDESNDDTTDEQVGTSENTSPDQSHPVLTEDDLYVYDGTQYLTIAPRVLNLHVLKDEFEHIEAFVQNIVIADRAGDAVPEYDEEWVKERLGGDLERVDG